MSEGEWGSCTDPLAMLSFLRDSGRWSDRKARLFACACCRRVWPLLADERSRAAVETAERLAEGGAARAEVRRVRRAAQQARSAAPREVRQAAKAAYESCHADPAWAASVVADYSAWSAPERPAELAGQAALLRDVLGNPFRPVPPLSPSLVDWQGGLIIQLAQAAYEHRHLPSGHLDLGRLAVLADALEDAGCTDAELLGHLRGEGPHWRGCVAVDAVLGRG